MSTTDAQQVARESSAAMVAADSAARSTGIRIVEIGPGHGVCHGGVLFLLADTAMAHACNSYGTSTVASGADIAFLRPASLGDELTATAAERALAGRSGLYDVTVRTGDGTAVAEFRGRTRQVPGLAAPPRVP